MKFDDETTDVLIGGYLSKDAAQDDYEAVLASGGYLHGAVVVAKDRQVVLQVFADHHRAVQVAAAGQDRLIVVLGGVLGHVTADQHVGCLVIELHGKSP